jgi:protein ImuB
VVACSHPARRAGIRRGMRRREAQSRCPDLVVLARDELAEARAFEPVVAAIESIAPGVEITRPGLAAIGARGPSRYFGSETAVIHVLSRQISPISADVLIGVADGAFAAEQAARRGVVVPAGQGAQFLAELPIETVEAPELVDLLQRLGIRTLGAFAALPARDVLGRFGPTGAWVHRQCGGRDARPIAARPPVAEHTIDLVFDTPIDRIDTIAFSARATAERFINGLLDRGLACTCLELIAQTENGEETVRRWRQAGVLNSVDVIDRIRWQLEGWLHSAGGPSAGVTSLRLVPVHCVPTGAHQQSLWAGAGAGDERAHRALARVQTLLGHGSVVTAARAGGRGPVERTRLVPWGDEREQPAVTSTRTTAAQPWPGRLPAPAPTVLIEPPQVVAVLDAAGHGVTVTARGAVPMAPARLALGTSAPVAVTAWAGPWPVDDTWWTDPSTSPESGPPLRRARFQLVDVQGRAYLVTYSFAIEDLPPSISTSSGVAQWTLNAIYD